MEADTGNEWLCSSRCHVHLLPIYSIEQQEGSADSLQRTPCIFCHRPIPDCLLSDIEDQSNDIHHLENSPVHHRSFIEKHKSSLLTLLCTITAQSILGGFRNCSIPAVFVVNAESKRTMKCVAILIERHRNLCSGSSQSNMSL